MAEVTLLGNSALKMLFTSAVLLTFICKIVFGFWSCFSFRIQLIFTTSFLIGPNFLCSIQFHYFPPQICLFIWFLWSPHLVRVPCQFSIMRFVQGYSPLLDFYFYPITQTLLSCILSKILFFRAVLVSQ